MIDILRLDLLDILGRVTYIMTVSYWDIDAFQTRPYLVSHEQELFKLGITVSFFISVTTS